jgi:hypothetical protein
MRTIAAAMLALALPSAAHAGLTAQPGPAGGYRSPPIAGPPDGSRTEPGPVRVSSEISHGPAGPGVVTVGRELDRARDDIERRRDSGELSRAEARQLRREARRIEAMADRYRRDGLTQFERRELELRATELRNRTATGRTS